MVFAVSPVVAGVGALSVSCNCWPVFEEILCAIGYCTTISHGPEAGAGGAGGGGGGGGTYAGVD